jgi:L-asparaginase
MTPPSASAPVVLITLGGTIAMAGTEGGVVARLTGADLLAGLPPGVDIEVKDRPAVPSADLTFAEVLDVVEQASRAVSDGARGVVLTQGTDTLEETAFLVDAVWPHDAPFVLTGAMRNPTLAGPDGPANVLGAVQVAASATARGRGALVVLADQVHAARHVRKAHSTSVGAFVSPDVGPVGHLVEGEARFLTSVPRLDPLPTPDPSALGATRVAFYPALLDDDGSMLRGLEEAHQGLVVAGFGVGHVPGRLAPVLGELVAAMPVVLASRTGAGPVLTHTYGAPGSERDLRDRGLVPAGFLHPYKARVLLRLLVAAGADRAEVATRFAAYG